MGGLALKRMVANNLREILGKAQDPKRAMREVARGLAEAELLVPDEDTVPVDQGIETFCVNVIEENPRIEDWLNHREYRLKKLLPQMYTVQGFLSVILRFSPPAAVIKEDLRAMSLDETIAAIARLFSDKRDSGR